MGYSRGNEVRQKGKCGVGKMGGETKSSGGLGYEVTDQHWLVVANRGKTGESIRQIGKGELPNLFREEKALSGRMGSCSL